jgi:drug/metabolite transporter (DMT)-like permease
MRWGQILPLALTGIVVNQIAFAWGIGLTTPSHSAIIHALIPVCVLIFSVMFLRERPAGVALLGLAIAVGGAVYLGLQASAQERRETLNGDILTTIGMAAFSAYIVLGRNVLATEGAFVTVTRAFVASVPLAIPVFIYGLTQQDWGLVTWKGWTSLAYMIVGATFICYSLHMWSLARLDALKVSVFTDAQPILAGLMAHAIGIEKVTTPLAIAAAIVIVGVVLVQLSRTPAKPA